MPSHFWFHSNQQTIYSCFCSGKPGKFFKVSEDFICYYFKHISGKSKLHKSQRGIHPTKSHFTNPPPNPPCFGDCEAWKEHLPAENHWQTSVGIGRTSYHFQQKYILQSYRFTILLNNNSPIEKTHEHATSQKNTSILFKFRFKIRETVLLTVNFWIFLQPVSLFYPLLHSAMLPLVVAILTQRIDSRH